MPSDLTLSVVLALVIGLMAGALLSVFMGQGRRIVTLVITALLVIACVTIATVVSESWSIIVTALLAISVGNVLTTVIRQKIRKSRLDSEK